MITVDTSTIIDAPVNDVWAIIRGFNSHLDWHPVVATSVIEDDLAEDAIGCVRSFTLQTGEALREQLIALSDLEHSFSYKILTSDVPLMNYTAHVKLSRVTASERTHWRWWSTFATQIGKEAELSTVVREGVYHAGFEAVAARVG